MAKSKKLAKEEQEKLKELFKSVSPGGSLESLSGELGLSRQAVHLWTQTGRVPDAHVESLKALAAGRDDLLTKLGEISSGKQKQAEKSTYVPELDLGEVKPAEVVAEKTVVAPIEPPVAQPVAAPVVFVAENQPRRW